MKDTLAIIQFPGSNTERETFMACERTGIKAKEFLWNTPPRQLSKFSGYIIIGGFSYEDRSRAGIIAALDPIMNQVKTEASKGKPVLGICNGAQILVESGLVPGSNDNTTCVSLTDNKRIKGGRVVGIGYYNTIKTNFSFDGCNTIFSTFICFGFFDPSRCIGYIRRTCTSTGTEKFHSTS